MEACAGLTLGCEPKTARRELPRAPSGRAFVVRSWFAYGTGFGCCCLIFSMYFWKNHFWMSIMLSSRPWMYA